MPGMLPENSSGTWWADNMSKIQEALRQMQDARQRRNESAEKPGEETQRLARVKRNGDADKIHEHADAESVVLSNNGHLAEVDRAALRAAGLIAPEHEERKLGDEYRQIKRPLIANAFGKRAAKVENGQLIMVASALPGDGKTFTCINLALSMALEKDYSIVLVDADVAKPHITSLFALEEHKGLLDLVEDPNLRISDAMIPTDIPRLSLLPSGRTRHYATELLASSRMDEVVKALIDGHSNRIVVFDSPPLLVTSESQVLAGLMGQLLVVVKAGVTPLHAVEEAVGTIDPSKAVNLVLNQARRSATGGGWGGYYYGYGSHYGKPPEDEKKEEVKESESR